MKRYRILLKEYEKLLTNKVKQRKLAEKTKDTYIRDANRTYEAVLSILPEIVIESIVRARGFKGDYKKVIADLRSIIKSRKRN